MASISSSKADATPNASMQEWMAQHANKNHYPAPIIPKRPIQKLLVGQKAIVTGSSSGIGAAIALALGQAGADVVVNYSSHRDPAEEIVTQIKNAGSNAFSFKADVSQEADVQAMFQKAITTFGTVDIVVSNSGIQDDAPLTEMSLEKWNHVIGINLTGQFLCAREAVREFLRRGVRPDVSVAAGKIICISSVHDIIPWAGHVNYASSKGGIAMMMKTIAQEVAPQRIRVNSISPGAIRTHINTDAWNTPEAYDKLMQLVPYKRIGEPEDIGRTAVWLASDDADYITGATLYVDGGMTLYPGFASGG